MSTAGSPESSEETTTGVPNEPAENAGDDGPTTANAVLPATPAETASATTLRRNGRMGKVTSRLTTVVPSARQRHAGRFLAPPLRDPPRFRAEPAAVRSRSGR